MEIDNENHLKATDHCVSTEIEGETTILQTETGQYYGLNETGTVIWDTLQTAATLEEIVRAVQEEFEVEADTCREDTMTILQKLIEEELVEVVD